jgi:hypothetical protein
MHVPLDCRKIPKCSSFLKVKLDFNNLYSYTIRMRIFQIYLTDPQIVALKKLSKKLDLSVAEIVRRAIDTFLEKQK